MGEALLCRCVLPLKRPARQQALVASDLRCDVQQLVVLESYCIWAVGAFEGIQVAGHSDLEAVRDILCRNVSMHCIFQQIADGEQLH